MKKKRKIGLDFKILKENAFKKIFLRKKIKKFSSFLKIKNKNLSY